MVNEISQEKAQIVYAMEQQLRNNLLHSDTNKLWENTYIKRQIDKRKENSSFSVNDHIRAMVYSMLSSGVAWNRIAENADIATGHIRDVDEIFCNYSPKQLLKCTPEQLGNSLNKIHCASQYTFIANMDGKRLLQLCRMPNYIWVGHDAETNPPEVTLFESSPQDLLEKFDSSIFADTDNEIIWL